MSTSFHLCQPGDLDTLLGLVQRRMEEAGTPGDPDHLRAGLAPLIAGDGAGAAYLFGPLKAPVGYLALTIGWSVALAAPEARVVDLFIRPSVRRRGLAANALAGVGSALRAGGVRALHMDLPDNPALMNLARKAGFARVPGQIPTTRAL